MRTTDFEHSTLVLAPLVAIAILVGASIAYAAGTPEQQCQAGKNKTAGKYAACRQNAEAKLATGGDVGKYNDTLVKCATKFTSAWQKLQAKAANAATACSDGVATESAFQSAIDGHTDKVAVALAGGGLQSCGNGTVEAPEECDGSNLDSETCATQGFALGTLRCASGCTLDTSGCFATRFTDNGDGTVTDHQTDLMWQKTDNAAGITDKDNTYAWSSGGSTANGPAFTVFLAGLNNCQSGNGSLVTGGYAGRCDWRLPGIAELQTILLAPFACGTNPCINQAVFGPTNASSFYWSATSDTDPAYAWDVSFSDGALDAFHLKNSTFQVRAVRPGS